MQVWIGVAQGGSCLSNIFLAISNHGDLLGGGEHSFIEFLSHLVPPWKPVAVVPQPGEVADRIEANRIDSVVIPLPSVRPWNIAAIIGSARSCAHVCKRVHAGLIYANGSRAAFYGGLLGRILEIPVVWHCRMTGRDIYLDPIITRLSNFIIANSRATAERFRGNSAGRVRVVYNGFDLPWLREKGLSNPDLVRPDWKVILMVSRISRWKRHDLALSAFELIASTDPHAHLVCVGEKDNLEPDWWEYLQQLSGRSPFSDRVHWIGRAEDIRPWYKSAHMLILPSDNEPFGRVLVEAMACGVPVIATRSGGVPEVVRGGVDGVLVAPGSAHEMSGQMLKLLRNETLRNRLSESGRKRAEDFGLEKHVDGMLRVFEEALGYRDKRDGR
jgi:glycosyltransferase involved in cell wall biosynthesis